ncbi:MAG TPA: NUDIX domain-containing protein [bacterium]|nr:NUDIX domain-containing protein [bacterium]
MKPGIDYIGVGCGCIVFNDKNEILLLKRSENSKTDRGRWTRPGGAVEFGETFEVAVKRELKEEAGIDIEVIRQLDYTDDLKTEDGIHKHWVTLGFLGKIVGGEPKNMEPDKHTEIGWFPLDQVPDNLTIYTKRSIDFLKKQ